MIFESIGAEPRRRTPSFWPCWAGWTLTVYPLTIPESHFPAASGSGSACCGPWSVGPEVLLLDEPTSALDRDSKKKVEDMAIQACQGGKTIVMVTHDDFVPDAVPIYEITINTGKVMLCQ